MVARFSASTSQLAPCPLIWTTARLREILPSSAAKAPTTPSRPTMAASIASPLESVTTSETTASGKIHCRYGLPGLPQNLVLREFERLEMWLKKLQGGSQRDATSRFVGVFDMPCSKLKRDHALSLCHRRLRKRSRPVISSI